MSFSFPNFFLLGFSGEWIAKGREVVEFTFVDVEPLRQHDKDTGDKGASPELSGKAWSSLCSWSGDREGTRFTGGLTSKTEREGTAAL